MDKLLAMNTFVRIVDCGSLTDAAKALGKSLPSVVRMLAALESNLGVRLLNRTTRRISLTEEGRHYLEQCQRILADIEEAENALSAEQSEPQGKLTVSAPAQFGQMHVSPLVTDFIERYEKISVDLLLLDRVVNLVEEGVDVGIRIAHLDDSTMIAKPVGHIRRVVCASPELLKKTGPITHPKQLADHDCVRFTHITTGGQWQFLENNKQISVHVDGRYSSNQAAASIKACAAGAGFGMFLSYMIEPHLKSGELQVILQEFELPPVPVNVVYAHARLMSTRTRVFVDWMAKGLREVLEGE